MKEWILIVTRTSLAMSGRDVDARRYGDAGARARHHLEKIEDWAKLRECSATLPPADRAACYHSSLSGPAGT
jgi:hypothetical protein